MYGKKIMIIVILTIFMMTLTAGISLAAAKEPHGHGSPAPEQAQEKSEDIPPVDNPHQDMTPANHELQDSPNTAGGHGTEGLERNYMVLYALLTVNLVVLTGAGILKYTRRREAFAS